MDFWPSLKHANSVIDWGTRVGRFSEVVFGRRELPEGCLIYAGAYLPSRKDWVRNLFDGWKRMRGQWVKFTFARKNGVEYLVVFNVYGASMILEIVQLLKEGNVKRVFFIGSLGGKELPVGTLVLPTRVVDKTGFVAIDSSGKQIVQPDEYRLKRLRRALDDSGEVYVEGEIVSVPCVLHNIEHLRSFVEQEEGIIGVECETSTYYHYTQKEKLESYGLLYISDNKKHDIISGGKNLRNVRRKSLRKITCIATRIMK
jgi:purine-nucleoside phosphorylase